ncbi:MAG TPA: type II secretion system protein GspK [Candidatus Paceibacterota bacterium]|nr:type II secretion system protein GspK [Verrucomicrobiota bacterium]HRY46829.1 type II secretion system protein GspK [Candidatus Paceibacterota bacterium]HSA01620.1 type II secretion system protein GspK [Candidatus Paceibacterota bacterium]
MTPSQRQHGSVLIIVLWIAFGLVSMALYFAQSMSFELRSADNRVARVEAEQAIAGAARYASNLLATVEEPGLWLDPLTYYYECEAVPVGTGLFWFLGREDRQDSTDQPYFSLVDEASKLNLNTATLEMLELLPRMTPELAAAIIDWRDSDSDVSEGGAEDESYQRLNPSYVCKNGKFESIDELRLVYGMDLEILYGEDTNLNGILDPQENDGDLSPPFDDRDGQLEPGLLEYVTVYTREPATTSDGSTRINVTSTNQQELATLLSEKLGSDRANQVLQQVTPTQTPVRSVLEFYLKSGMTAEEFILVETNLTVSTNTVEGLINVNTAGEVVLACVPGIGFDLAPSVVSYRQSNPDKLQSITWVTQVLESTNAIAAGPYLTTRTYQVTADIVALGHQDRGFSRAKYVLDSSEGTPRVVFRQDLTGLGWALGAEYRRNQLLARKNR